MKKPCEWKPLWAVADIQRESLSGPLDSRLSDIKLRNHRIEAKYGQRHSFWRTRPDAPTRHRAVGRTPSFSRWCLPFFWTTWAHTRRRSSMEEEELNGGTGAQWRQPPRTTSPRPGLLGRNVPSDLQTLDVGKMNPRWRIGLREKHDFAATLLALAEPEPTNQPGTQPQIP